MLFSDTRFTGIGKPHTKTIKNYVCFFLDVFIFGYTRSRRWTGTLSLSENWSSRHYAMAKQPTHFTEDSFHRSLNKVALIGTGHCLLRWLQPTYVWPIIFKWPYFKHLWAKNIFSHSSRVKIICLESFSQMSISIFVLCWPGSNKSTMGFIHKNATILIFVLSKMWDLYAFML